jgi:acylphosphatase
MHRSQVFIVMGGRVQGVGFRYFALHRANEFHISGWVRNTPDGKVEIEAEGETQNLSEFIGRMKIGPARAIVQTFSVAEIQPPRNFTSFTIR